MPMRTFAIAVAVFATAATAQEPALRGFDPIALCRGEELAGGADRTAQRGAFTYRFASDANREAFLAEPERFEVQFDGACARMGPLSGLGSAQRWLVHEERIYVFASEPCRDAFKKQPAQFLDPDAPEPVADGPASEAGERLLARAVEAHGGAARLREWRTYRHERSTSSGDVKEDFRVQLQLPGSARLDHDYTQGKQTQGQQTQGKQTWRNANVLTPAAAFFVLPAGPSAMGGAARRELERRLSREPLWALRQALDEPPVVLARGKREVMGVAVDELELWRHGCSTTFGIDSDGRVRTARFRGRGPSLWLGAVEMVFDDFRTVGGLVVPATVRATFDGKDAPPLAERREKIEVDGELPAELFSPPK